MTSEEKLLKLIRKKPLENLKEYKKTLGGVSTKSEKVQKSADFLNVANRMLLVCVVGIVGYFMVSQLRTREEGDSFSVKEESREAVEKVSVELSLPEERPFSYYQQRIEKRDIFQSPWEKPKIQRENPVLIKSFEDLNKKIKIVGIVLDQNPQVIVENFKSKETVFLFLGDKIEGAILQEVQESKVIFLYQGKQVELFP